MNYKRNQNKYTNNNVFTKKTTKKKFFFNAPHILYIIPGMCTYLYNVNITLHTHLSIYLVAPKKKKRNTHNNFFFNFEDYMAKGYGKIALIRNVNIILYFIFCPFWSTENTDRTQNLWSDECWWVFKNFVFFFSSVC